MMKQCVIYSKAFITDIETWKPLFKTNNADGNIVSLYPQMHETKLNNGYGVFINNDTVLTCKHIIDGETYCYIKNGITVLKRNLYLVNEFYEYDIILLSTILNKQYKHEPIECMTINDAIKFKTGTISIPNQENNLNCIKIDATIKGIDFVHLKSMIFSANSSNKNYNQRTI